MPYARIVELQHVDRFNARSPISIDCLQYQFVSLQLQISDIEYLVKNLKYHIRIAKRQSRNNDVYTLQTERQDEQFKLNALRNQRNRLRKLLKLPAPVAPYRPKTAKWTAKSRREQHKSVEALRRTPAFARILAAGSNP